MTHPSCVLSPKQLYNWSTNQSIRLQIVDSESLAQKWIGLPYAAIAASLNASLSVGYKWENQFQALIEENRRNTYVSMRRSPNILRARAVLHRQRPLCNHLSRIRACTVLIQYLVS